MKAMNPDQSSAESEVKVKFANARASSSSTGVAEPDSIVPLTCDPLETACVIALVAQRYGFENLSLAMGMILHRNT